MIMLTASVEYSTVKRPFISLSSMRGHGRFQRLCLVADRGIASLFDPNGEAVGRGYSRCRRSLDCVTEAHGMISIRESESDQKSSSLHGVSAYGDVGGRSGLGADVFASSCGCLDNLLQYNSTALQYQILQWLYYAFI
ncbi:hypothetical protein HRR83_003791 [Exophiala dermatitidis]|uniref:Uncharacterized protein n=1 Tax=Exophiala dermatitidis TaxID=5970 RepID=A0AAN6F0E0_EXODE|nr:hypothetical protein HRR74_002828 [Exophiala dermatitidis]KAJ4529572.1 hypothetical protein HRR73_000597 [Exophiala dermatitidis]KAJ4543269.1 hypothetical protein HRR77_005524 [Exophiala dermatitidis]KAJ4543768.1 hypothetical protein HRR76_001831 [Exophiala dermatitidis]KAJ4575234.1 hypothetical protein HRR79_002162 [Exophiala dermatitidis]